MALFPCSVGAHRYSGAQKTMYPAITTGGDSTRGRLRLCTGHFREYMDRLEISALRAQLEFDTAQTARCYNCGDLADRDSLSLFVTTYAGGEEREDFWAPVHRQCARTVAQEWRLDLDSLNIAA